MDAVVSMEIVLPWWRLLKQDSRCASIPTIRRWPPGCSCSADHGPLFKVLLSVLCSQHHWGLHAEGKEALYFTPWGPTWETPSRLGGQQEPCYSCYLTIRLVLKMCRMWGMCHSLWIEPCGWRRTSLVLLLRRTCTPGHPQNLHSNHGQHPGGAHSPEEGLTSMLLHWCALLKKTLLQGGHTEGPETYEKMLSITSHQRDAN